MYNVRRKEYRGYRIETYLRDPAGWRVYLYRLSTHLPPMVRQRDIRYASAADALAAGQREIDMELDTADIYKQPRARIFVRTLN